MITAPKITKLSNQPAWTPSTAPWSRNPATGGIEQPACLDPLNGPLVQESSHQGQGAPGRGGAGSPNSPTNAPFLPKITKLSNQPAWTPSTPPGPGIQPPGAGGPRGGGGARQASETLNHPNGPRFGVLL